MSFSIRWCIVPKWEVMTRANPERQPKILHFVQDVTSERERLCRMGAAAGSGFLSYFSATWKYRRSAVEKQLRVPPLRCASVGMTRFRGEVDISVDSRLGAFRTDSSLQQVVQLSPMAQRGGV